MGVSTCKGMKEGNRFEGSMTVGLWANDGRTGNQVKEVRQALTEEGKLSQDMCLLAPFTRQ